MTSRLSVPVQVLVYRKLAMSFLVCVLCLAERWEDSVSSSAEEREWSYQELTGSKVTELR